MSAMHYTVPVTNQAGAPDVVRVSSGIRSDQVSIATTGARVELATDDAWGLVQAVLRQLAANAGQSWDARVTEVRKALADGLAAEDVTVPDDDALSMAAQDAMARLAGLDRDEFARLTYTRRP